VGETLGAEVGETLGPILVVGIAPDGAAEIVGTRDTDGGSEGAALTVGCAEVVGEAETVGFVDTVGNGDGATDVVGAALVVGIGVTSCVGP